MFLVLDKLGIELKVPSIGSSTIPSTQVTPQQLLQKSMEAQVEKVKVQTGIELPSYYNPVAVNPNKYAEQIQKRKLLWGNKQNNDVVKQVEESKPAVAATNKTATIWQSTKFGDQDGKVTAKFKRLMGIKDNEKGKALSQHLFLYCYKIFIFIQVLMVLLLSKGNQKTLSKSKKKCLTQWRVSMKLPVWQHIHIEG